MQDDRIFYWVQRPQVNAGLRLGNRTPTGGGERRISGVVGWGVFVVAIGDRNIRSGRRQLRRGQFTADQCARRGFQSLNLRPGITIFRSRSRIGFPPGAGEWQAAGDGLMRAVGQLVAGEQHRVGRIDQAGCL